MFPPLFAALDGSAAARILFGPNPMRVYAAGDAPANAQTPYLVWQTIAGSPENYLAGLPDTDGFTTQIDVYGQGGGEKPLTALRTAAKAARDAIEPVAYIVGWRGESRDPDTNLYRYSFDVDWLTSR